MKTAGAPKTVDDYLAAVPEPAHSALQKLRATIRSVVPAETEEGLSYGMPAFKYKGPLVAYAAFKAHCSLFPMSGSALEAFEGLKPFRTSKGTLQFTVEKPIPAALVKKLVKARVAQNELKKKR
jgi:uncharacterized protein YdhG (YjbR/CyaY superfamily)